VPTENVHVVWNGIDITKSRRRQDARGDNPMDEFFPPVPGRKVACLIGMFRPEKDHGLALHVAQVLARTDPRWRVLFVGDSLPHTDFYKEQIIRTRRQLNLEDVVALSGLRADVLDIARASNVVFSTSRNEGFPNVVIEAMAVGTPVVSTEYSDIRLILPREWQIVKSRDPRELADAIIRSDRERRSLSQQQSEWVHANATLGSQVDRLEAVYRKYLAA
jgi:glycosyltransferase involved in cell wall biosynthesis